MKTKMRSKFTKGMYMAALLSLSLAVTAQKRPDFSGKWKLNDSKSELRAEFSFAPESVTIEQDKAKMVYTSVVDFQGSMMEQTNTYNLDGSDSMNEGWQGTETTSNATWSDDGKKLRVVTKVEMQDGGELQVITEFSKEKQNLSMHISLEGGPMEFEPETWVFDKE